MRSFRYGLYNTQNGLVKIKADDLIAAPFSQKQLSIKAIKNYLMRIPNRVLVNLIERILPSIDAILNGLTVLSFISTCTWFLIASCIAMGVLFGINK